MGKIGILAPDKELENRVKELFKDDYDNEEFLIDILDSKKIENQGIYLEKKGVKAIIARSGGFFHSFGKVNIPLIRLKITAIDILQAINKAITYKKRIILFLWDEIYFEKKDWMNVLKTNIKIERFKNKDEIIKKIDEYKEFKDDVVIIGGGIAFNYCKKLNIDTVFLNASKDSLYETIKYTKDLIDNLESEKYWSQVLKNILNGVHDAIIAIDNDFKIVIFNEKAKKLLKKENEVIGKKINEVFSNMNFLSEYLVNKKDSYGEVRYLNNLVLTTNTSIIEVDGKIYGALCSFQDITKLQNLEKKIRYQINKKGLIAKYNFNDMIAKDNNMINTIKKARRIGMSDFTVIIYGESGTGKEMIAQSIHNISNRRSGPFVAINCAAISENLLESELFGYEEGAFTGARKGGKPGLFEIAHKGTLFLDELNSIPLNLQGKLLRVLEEQEVMRLGSDYVIPLDVRIIAAANEELKEKVYDKTFRRDLFYRLNMLELKIPPLRDRKDDIIPLFEHLIYILNEEKNNISLSKEEKESLINYNWPGNVRELRNIVQRYLLFNEIDLNYSLDNKKLTDTKEIDDEHYVLEKNKLIFRNLEEDFANDIDIKNTKLKNIINLKEINSLVEKSIIKMLFKAGFSKNEISKILGISRTSLWNKIKKDK